MEDSTRISKKVPRNHLILNPGKVRTLFCVGLRCVTSPHGNRAQAGFREDGVSGCRCAELRLRERGPGCDVSPSVILILQLVSPAQRHRSADADTKLELIVTPTK